MTANERVLRAALQYIVDHAWAAETRQPAQWIREFVDVATQALGATANPLSDLGDRKMPPVVDAYKRKRGLGLIVDVEA